MYSKFFHLHVCNQRTTLPLIRNPNTNGIHIIDSTNIYITNLVISLDNDSASIILDCTNMTIFNMLYNPTHDISINNLYKNMERKMSSSWQWEASFLSAQ